MRLFILAMLCFSGICECLADSKITVKNSDGKAVAYNLLVGKERNRAAEKDGSIVLDSQMTNEPIYLIHGNHRSIFFIPDNEEMEVKLSDNGFVYTGKYKKINTYLAQFTNRVLHTYPNMLTPYTEGMMREIPNDSKKYPEPDQLCGDTYINWLKNGAQSEKALLKKAGIKDKAFVSMMEKRIEAMFFHIAVSNLSYAKSRGTFDITTYSFIKNIELNDNLLDYQRMDDFLRDYVTLCAEMDKKTVAPDNYIMVRAAYLPTPKLKETYALNEFELVIRNAWSYDYPSTLNQVSKYVVTEEGKSKQKLLSQTAQSTESRNGEYAPRFNYTTFDGKEISSSSFTGKFLFIDLWASWCGPCKYQIPYVQKLEHYFEGQPIEFLSLSLDVEAKRGEWEKLVKEYGINKNAVIDISSFKGDYATFYGIKSIPRFVLIGPNGKVIMEKARRPSDPILKNELERLVDAYKSSTAYIQIEGLTPANTSATIYRQGIMMTTLGNAINHNGTIHAYAPVNNGEYVYLSIPKIGGVNIFVQQGAKIQVKVENGNLIFAGDNAKLNQTILQIEKEHRSLVTNKRPTHFNKTEEQNYLSVYYKLIEQSKQAKLSVHDQQLLEGYIQKLLLSNLYGNISMSKVFGKGFARPVVSKEYGQLAQQILWNPTLSLTSGWEDLLTEHLNTYIVQGKTKINTPETYIADIASQIGNKELREKYMKQVIKMEALRGHVVGIESRVSHVKKLFNNPKDDILALIQTDIDKYRQKYKNAQPGDIVNNYTFSQRNGKAFNLESLKGNYVFIDLWSTGCNPCIGEMPYIADMEKRFKGKPIKWVSISLDTNKDTWQKFLNEKGAHGIHLIAENGFKHPFIQEIGLSGIPRFILLDKEGKVVDGQALRPSNPVLGELIEQLFIKQ